MSRYRALTSFALPGGAVVREGSVLDGSDPAYKGREHLFTDDEGPQPAGRPVEQATAAPGEKRPAAKTAACPVDGCDYEGTERGLKIHTGQVHDH